jgi:hypothetical protein
MKTTSFPTAPGLVYELAAVFTHPGAFFLYRPRRLGEGREVESPAPKGYPHRSLLRVNYSRVEVI